MADFPSIVRKITRPPGAQNCARLNAIGDELATTKLIAKLALGIPAFNYVPGIGQCRTHVQMPLLVDTAVSAVLKCGAPAGREHNADFVRAFFAYDAHRGYSNAQLVGGYDGEYRLSRDVRVPTKPTFTILEGGNLVPIILCGWKSLPLTMGQIRFWLTMLEFGLYSHADYRRSPAEIVLFIEELTDKGPVRVPLVIRRGDYTLFSESEMREQAELYVRAQAAALPIVEAAWVEKQRRKQQEEGGTADRGGGHPGPIDPTLFD